MEQVKIIGQEEIVRKLETVGKLITAMNLIKEVLENQEFVNTWASDLKCKELLQGAYESLDTIIAW